MGGAPTNYNLNYSYEGFDYLNKYAIFRLHTIRLFYCSRVGNQVIGNLYFIFNNYFIYLYKNNNKKKYWQINLIHI